MHVRDEELLRQEMTDFGLMKSDDWTSEEYLPNPAEKRVRLDVGGQVCSRLNVSWKYDGVPSCTLRMIDRCASRQQDQEACQPLQILRIINPPRIPVVDVDAVEV